MMDLNDAPEQQTFGALPAGTLVKVGFAVKAGGQGADGSLTGSKTSGSLMLHLDCTVISDPHKNKRIFDNWIVETADQQPTPGVSKAINISRSRLRALINSAKGIPPKENGDLARQARIINGYGDVHGMVAAVRLGVDEPPKEGPYANKEPENTISQILEPGDQHYNEVMGGMTIKPGEKPQQQGGQQGWQAPAAQQPAQQPVQQNFAGMPPQQPAQQPQGNWQQPPAQQPMQQPVQQPMQPQQPQAGGQQWAPPQQPQQPAQQPQADQAASGAPNWALPG